MLLPGKWEKEGATEGIDPFKLSQNAFQNAFKWDGRKTGSIGEHLGKAKKEASI